MFVDASAIVAIIAREPDWEILASALESASSTSLVTSVLAVWEAAVSLSRVKNVSMAEAENDVREFLSLSDVQLVGIAPEELTLALEAFDRYGRHRLSPEERNRALNLADCFHYAYAKSRSLPILHKDLGFKLTDIVSVDATR